MSKVPSKQKQRHNARKAAMQALYQWQFTSHSATELIQQYLEDNVSNVLDLAYFQSLVKGTLNSIHEIDADITPTLDRDIKDLNPVELAILRISTYELAHQPDVPYRVVINEALELAKSFGSDQGHKYVNAVLDKLAIQLRPSEIRAKKK